MSEQAETPDAPEASPGLPEGVPTEDPFPKVFVVCFGIFIVLIVLIFGVILFDMTQRVERRVLQVPLEREAPAPAPSSPPE